MTGFRRLLPVIPLGAALAVTPVAGAATYELHATARSAHGFTVTLRHATVYDVGVGQVARRVTRGKGWKQTDEIEIHRRRVFSADIQRDPAAPPDGPFGPARATAHVQADGPFLTGSLNYGPRSGIVVSDEYTFVGAEGPVTGMLTARFGRLGGPVVTMRPATGRLTQEWVQCI